MPVAIPPDARRNIPGAGLGAPLTLDGFRQHVRAAASTGRVRFLPWLDRGTKETPEIRAAYREMTKEPVIKAALKGKVAAIASLPLQAQPEDDMPRAKDVADSTLAGILNVAGGFSHIARTLLYPGMLFGVAVAQKWDDIAPTGKWRGKKVFTRLQGLDTEDGPRVRLHTDEHLNVTGVQPLAYNDGRIFPPEQFVIYRYDSLFDAAIGTSDMRAVYRAYWFKDTAYKLRGLRLERWATPALKGKYNAQQAGAKDELEDALIQFKGDTYLMLPEGLDAEVMQIALGGDTEFQAAISYYDEQMALGIAGAFLQMLTSRGGSGDMRGDADTQRGTAELFTWDPAEQLAQVITHQLGKELVRDNWMPGTGCPTFTVGAVNDAELLRSAQLHKQLQDLGYNLSKSAGAKYFGVQLAADEADTLRPPQAAPAAPGMGGMPFADPNPSKAPPTPPERNGGPSRPFPS